MNQIKPGPLTPESARLLNDIVQKLQSGGVPTSAFEGGIYDGNAYNDSLLNQPFPALITGYNGGQFYSWYEIKGFSTGSSAGWVESLGSRSGTFLGNPAFEANGNSVSIGTVVWLSRSTFDPVLGWLMSFEAPGGSSGSTLTVEGINGIVTAPAVPNVTTIQIDNNSLYLIDFIPGPPATVSVGLADDVFTNGIFTLYDGTPASFGNYFTFLDAQLQIYDAALGTVTFGINAISTASGYPIVSMYNGTIAWTSIALTQYSGGGYLNIAGNGLSLNGTVCFTGTFTSGTGQTVTVQGGLIVSVV